jgi:TPR repeat protein
MGDGVSVDKVESVKWYRLAAAQGDAEAQFNLGVIYSEGAENGSPDAITFMNSQCE